MRWNHRLAPDPRYTNSLSAEMSSPYIGASFAVVISLQDSHGIKRNSGVADYDTTLPMHPKDNIFGTRNECQAKEHSLARPPARNAQHPH